MVPLLPVYVAGLFGLVAAVPMQHYATKYDHIDIEMILNNRRMVNYYAACLLGKGPCPPEGLVFKRILPESLRTNCMKCTEKQKTVTYRTIKRLKKEYPKIWDQLQNVWDPNGSLTAKFEATHGNLQSGPVPSVSRQLLNRFGTDNDAKKDDDTVIKKLASAGSTTSVPTTSGEAVVPIKNIGNVSTKDNSIVIKEITSTSTSIPTTAKKAVASTKKSTSTSTSIPTTAKKAVAPTKKSSNQSEKPSSIAKKIITSTETVTTANKITTNAPITPSTTTNYYYTPPVRFRPLANIGAGIEATVSLGTDIVGNLVRGIGALGDRVVETGAEIAGVVLKSITRPL